MSKFVKYSLILLSTIVFVASAIWYYNVRDYEPLIALTTSIIALIGLPFVKTKDGGNIKMKQKAGANSTQYQSGGDMNIH